MIKLRDYQQKAVDDIRNSFSKGLKKVIVSAPTGAGKTIIFSYVAQNVAAKRKKVLILTDRFELLTQTGGAIKSFGINPYYIQAGTKYLNKQNEVFVAMAQTLRRRVDQKLWINWIKKEIDLVIIDEAHRQEFNYMFENQEELLKDKFVLGFTATPQRSGSMRQLAIDYEDIIETISVKELVEKGFLVSDDYFGVTGANIEELSVNRLKGDFDEKEMFSRFNSPKLYAGVFKNWMEISPKAKTLIFCVNIEHCIHTCEEFQKNGIDARFVVSGMKEPKEPKKDEKKKGIWVQYEEKVRLYNLYKTSFGKWSGNRGIIIDKFKKGQFPVLINAGILTTGFDDPTIESVVINRATNSASLWLQMIGRGSRIHPSKSSFNILDFGSNASRLGHYTMKRAWSLWHEKVNTGGGVPPVKDCKGCERMIIASIKICPFCGYKYQPKKIKEAALEMLAFNPETHKAIKTKRVNDMNDQEMFDYFKMKKHKMSWLWRQLYYRGGKEKIENFGVEKGWSKGTIEKAINYVSSL